MARLIIILCWYVQKYNVLWTDIYFNLNLILNIKSLFVPYTYTIYPIAMKFWFLCEQLFWQLVQSVYNGWRASNFIFKTTWTKIRAGATYLWVFFSPCTWIFPNGWIDGAINNIFCFKRWRCTLFKNAITTPYLKTF